MSSATVCVVAGDLNLHHKRWLKYSNDNSSQGEMMQNICLDFDLHEIIRKPTRGEYLLDLMLTNAAGCTSEVGPKLSDHHCIIGSIPLPVPQEQILQRHLWHFQGASWQNMICELKNVRWECLKKFPVSEAVNYFSEVIWQTCVKYIPFKIESVTKRSHPWLNQRCKKCNYQEA